MGTRFPVWSVVAVLFLTSEVACAQDLPAKPVRLLVPSVAGGPSDFAARLIAPKLGVALDRNVIVDARASVDVVGQGEIETRRYTRGEGNNKKTYYDADVYQVDRHVDFTVDDLTVESSRERGNLDASANTNNIINTILPFDTKNAVKWNASYLRGCSSEKRDLDVEHMKPRLADQLLSIARARVESSVNRYGRGVRWEQEGLKVHGSRWVAMYLPVWLYSYHQPGGGGGLLHYIAVNGRTGETMGSVPVQKWKLFLVSLTAGTFLEGIVLWFMAVTS